MASFAESSSSSLSLSAGEEAALRLMSDVHVQALVNNTKDSSRNCDGNYWALNFSKDELKLKVYSSVAANVKLLRFKAVCILPYDVKTIVDFVEDNINRMTWDRNVCDIKTHDVYSSDDASNRVKLLRVATKQVGPISGRDFVDVISIRKIENGKYVNAGASISAKEIAFTEKCFPEGKAFVRGWNFSGGGWMFEPIETSDGSNSTQISYVIHTDLRGWFAPAIINQVIGGSYVSFFEDLTKALAKRLSS